LIDSLKEEKEQKKGFYFSQHRKIVQIEEKILLQRGDERMEYELEKMKRVLFFSYLFRVKR